MVVLVLELLYDVMRLSVDKSGMFEKFLTLVFLSLLKTLLLLIKMFYEAILQNVYWMFDNFFNTRNQRI